MRTTTFKMLCAATIASTYAGSAAAAGLRNFRELGEFYSSSMGVSSQSANIRTTFEQVKYNLPQTSDTSQFSKQTFLATSALAAAYCGEFVTQEARLSPQTRRIHQSVDFSSGPVGITAEIADDAVRGYAQAFWGRDVTDGEKQLIATISSHLLASLPNTAAATKWYFRSICTSLASSLDSVVIYE